MAGDPGRLVKRYAGDFWALGCLLARELPFFLRKARSTRVSPVANGIGGSLERVAVCDGCDWDALHKQVMQSDRSVIVLDCAELLAPELPICSELAALAKAARQAGKVAAVYGGGARLGAYLAKIGMADTLPVFEYPLALEAWAVKQTSVFAGRTWTLRVPANLTESRIKEFRGCVRELARWLRAEGDTLRLCLDEVNRASLTAMLQLARWCEDFEGRSQMITLSGGTEELRETFRIIGLEDYLEEAPLPLEGMGGSAVFAKADRAEVALPSSEEDDELALGGEALWD
jgi:anti-anti-sigma regulatory factor